MKVELLDNIITNEPMYKHTTFRLGGPADYYFEPSCEEELIKAINYAKEDKIPITILGNGSNVLVKDKGIRGLLIKLGKNFSKITVNGTKIEALAGALMPAVAGAALENSLKGLEFASSIPGSIGGGLYMNAGAYDEQLSDVVVRAEYIENGQIKTIDKDDMALSYRKSIFEEKDLIITKVILNLSYGDREEIKTKCDDLRRRRQEKQPLELASAGSTFKRPTGYFAGALIEQCGLKGKKIGDAQVSKKHAGFIVNNGNATANDVIELMDFVQKEVLSKTGVKLEPEVKILGE